MREGRWLWHCGGGGGNPFVSGQRYICSAAGGRRGINWTNIVGDATSKSAYFKGFRGSSIRALASQGNNNYMNYLGRDRPGGVDSFVNGSEFKCKSLSDRNPQTLNGGEQKRGGALHDALRCFDRQ